MKLDYTVRVETFEIVEQSDRHSSNRCLLRWHGELLSSHETLAEALRALADELDKWDFT